MSLQEQYIAIADEIDGLRQRAAKLLNDGGAEVPKIAAGMLNYHLQHAKAEAMDIARTLAPEGTRAAGQ